MSRCLPTPRDAQAPCDRAARTCLGRGLRRLSSRALQSLACAAAVFVLAVVPGPTNAAPIVSAEVVTVGVGDVFSIDIEVADAVNLVSWQLDLGFDPAIVQASAVSEGPFLSSSGTTLFNPGVIDNVTGLISLASASFVDLAPPSGSGVLMTVEFLALGPGVSALALSNVFLNLLDADFTLQNGQITVVGDGGPIPVPEPGTIGLLATGFLLLHARHRRPRRHP
jgi:hypothetical protein